MAGQYERRRNRLCLISDIVVSSLLEGGGRLEMRRRLKYIGRDRRRTSLKRTGRREEEKRKKGDIWEEK